MQKNGGLREHGVSREKQDFQNGWNNTQESVRDQTRKGLGCHIKEFRIYPTKVKLEFH